MKQWKCVGGLAVVAFGLVGCGASDQIPEVDDPQVVVVLGPKGGRLAFDGGRLEVPAGALTSTLTITAQPEEDGRQVVLRPAGLRFERPVDLYLKATSEDDEVIIKILDTPVAPLEGGPLFEAFATHRQGDFLHARVRGFSRYRASRSGSTSSNGFDQPGRGPSQAGELRRPRWNPCRRSMTLEWTGPSEVVVHRILQKRGELPQTSTLVVPGATAQGPGRFVEVGFPLVAPDEWPFTAIYETYVVDRRQAFLVDVDRVLMTEVSRPEGVANLRIAHEAPDELTLRWDGSPDSPSGYEIAREPPFPGGSNPRTVSQTHFRDGSVVPGMRYRYAVRPFITCSEDQLWGPYQSVTRRPAAPMGPEPPATVQGLVASASGREVTVRWQGAPNARGYRVQRVGPGAGAALELGTVSATSIVEEVPGPGMYRYTVTPVDAEGSLGTPASISVEVRTVACGGLRPLMVEVRYAGQLAPLYEFIHILETGGDPSPEVELSLQGPVDGRGRYEWAIDNAGGARSTIGQDPIVRYELPCRADAARSACRIHAQVVDDCGSRTAVAYIEVRS